MVDGIKHKTYTIFIGGGRILSMADGGPMHFATAEVTSSGLKFLHIALKDKV